MKITYRMLRLANACNEQVNLFRDLFPNESLATAFVEAWFSQNRSFIQKLLHWRF